MKALRGFTKSAGDMNLAKGPHELTQVSNFYYQIRI